MCLGAFLVAIRQALFINEWWSTKLLIVESSAGRLIMRKVRLAERVTEIVVLIRTVKDGPDVTIEPRSIIRVPLEPASTPMNQCSLISRCEVLWIIKCSGRAVEIGPCRKLTDGHVFDDIVHRNHVKNLRNIGWIGADDPGRIFHVDVT